MIGVFPMAECLEDDQLGEEIVLANHEYGKQLKNIENGAFHDGFDHSNESTLQNAFNQGYELAFGPFEVISRAEGILDVALHHLDQRGASFDINQLKTKITELNNTIFSELEAKSRENISSKSETQLSGQVRSLFLAFQNDLRTLIESNHLDALVPLIDELKLIPPTDTNIEANFSNQFT